MSDTSTPTSTPASTQEIAAVIAELEQYRDRLIQDSTETAKKAKLTKSALMAQIEPELQKIDTALTQLRAQIHN
jgi:capsule polysaccharide export protein KpsE/RkpR